VSRCGPAAVVGRGCEEFRRVGRGCEEFRRDKLSIILERGIEQGQGCPPAVLGLGGQWVKGALCA